MFFGRNMNYTNIRSVLYSLPDQCPFVLGLKHDRFVFTIVGTADFRTANSASVAAAAVAAAAAQHNQLIPQPSMTSQLQLASRSSGLCSAVLAHALVVQ